MLSSIGSWVGSVFYFFFSFERVSLVYQLARLHILASTLLNTPWSQSQSQHSGRSCISSLKQSVPKDVPSLLEDKLAGLVNCYFLGVGFIEILRKVLMIQKHHIKYQMLEINFHSAPQWQ